jgi:hypothetical protein
MNVCRRAPRELHFRNVLGDAHVSLSSYVATYRRAAAPLRRCCCPRPTGKLLQPVPALGVTAAPVKDSSLFLNPSTKRESIDCKNWGFLPHQPGRLPQPVTASSTGSVTWI